MMRTVIFSAAVCAAAMDALSADAFAAPAEGWSGDLEAARREAKRAGRPMWVVVRCER